MSESKKDKKNKNLNEQDVEKVSGGMPVQKIIGRDKLTPAEILALLQPLTYGASYSKPWEKIQSKKKTSSSNEVKNLQPFSDEDKNPYSQTF